MEIYSHKTRKVLFYILILGTFGTVLFFTCVTPVMSDDILMLANPFPSLKAILIDCYEEYMSVNARQVTHFIWRCFMSGPKWFFNICNAIAFTVTMWFLYCNISNRKKYDVGIFLLIVLLVWKYGVAFAETVLWEGGSCNYLWGALIILGFITWYRYLLKQEESGLGKTNWVQKICLLLLGVLAGWCNENSSGGCLLIILIFTFFYYLEKKKIKDWMIFGILGNVIGLGILVLAPGNRNRSAIMGSEEEHTGILKYVGRFLKINAVVEQYFLVMLIIIGFILCYALVKQMDMRVFKVCFIFLFASIATSYVLLLIPSPMNRAHFCSGLFLTIACVEAIAQIPKDDVHMNMLKYGGIVALTIVMYFTYVNAGANLTRIYRETVERDQIITEQISQGNYDVVVPEIRPIWDNEYTFFYGNDVSEDPDSWGNFLYKKLYRLDSIVGMPREQWDEQYGQK